MAKVLIVFGGAVICLSSCSGERPTFARRMPSSDAAAASGALTDASDDRLADASPGLTDGQSTEADEETSLGSETDTFVTGTADASNESTDAGVGISDQDQEDACVANCGESKCSNASCVEEIACGKDTSGQACGDAMVCDEQGLCERDCPMEVGPERNCTSECSCAAGVGICTQDNQCEAGLVCTADAATKLGAPGSSCLPAHCVNDAQDPGETSVDCGGACGCRATYEVVAVVGIPKDAYAASLSAMNADGSMFAAHLSRGRGVFFPARITADGVVTELPAFGLPGRTSDISADGSVIIGTIQTGDPPSDDRFYDRAYRWTGDADPEMVYDPGSGAVSVAGRAISATGAIAAGNYRSPDEEVGAVFRVTSAQSRHLITALDWAAAMSADGLFIAGRLAGADEGAVWSHQQNALVPLDPPAAWSRWEITAMNADGTAFAGHGSAGETSFGFIWREGKFTELPQLPDAEFTRPYAVNANGTVVTGVSGTFEYQRAFIWDEERGTRRVVDEARARGLELPVDLELPIAEFLSADGRIIVGNLLGASTPSFWRITLLD